MTSLYRPSSRTVHIGNHSVAERAFVILVGLLAIWAASVPESAFAQRRGRRMAQQVPAQKKADDSKTDATDKAAPATDRETIGFGQQKAAAQMDELEERMFRLSEALRGLEPENASRLRLALKFSREEQILEQMRETQKLLKDAQLSKAETETKELIAKLEHLRNLLLAEDLDFQLKLARLRQMRETLGQLDRIVKEQRRELGWSRFAVDERKRLQRMTARRPDLAALVRDQESVIADTKKASNLNQESAKEARSEIRERETKLRNAANALATDPLFADLQPPHLRHAQTQLAEAVTSLERADDKSAVAAQEKALGLMRNELARLDEQVTQGERTTGEAEFRRRGGEQAKSRGTAETLEDTSARLGDVGVSLRKDLIRATALMRTAEKSLEKAAAGPAADDQSNALDVLAKSREDFTRSIEKLLVELRSELRTRLIGELMEMHELHKSVLETTQAEAPRVAKKSRTALITLAGASRNVTELAERTEHLNALVDETEFGIALPTTLRIFAREMRAIGVWLKEGDASPRTIAMETRLEEDVLKLAQAVRRLPPQTPPAPDAPMSADLRERERELNRLVAELTMVRMLQARLNDDTIGVDKTRPGANPLPPAVLREVEALEATQDEIRDSLAKISERLQFPEENQ
jgi:hypothetical protein